MVKYYGRARQRTGSVNTNQLGLKMAGCPSKIGRQGYISRYIQRRVNCAEGVCGIPKVHMVPWRSTFRNFAPFCKCPSTTCLAAAGGIRAIYTPYYKTPAPGTSGCVVNQLPTSNILVPPANLGGPLCNGLGFPIGGT